MTPTNATAQEPRLSPLDSAIVRMIASRVGRETLEQISRSSGISYSRIRILAAQAQLKYKHRHPTPEQIRGAVNAVCKEGLTFRAAGRKFGMSKTAVHRFVIRERQKSIDRAGELIVQNGDTKYSKAKRTWHCPEHGRLTMWPCVACAALEAKRKASGRF